MVVRTGFVLQHASRHFPCQTAGVSESALYSTASGHNHRQSEIQVTSQAKETPPTPLRHAERIYKNSDRVHSEELRPSASRALHFTSRTHWLGIFKRRWGEENVCSCSTKQGPQRAPFHQNTGHTDRGGTMKIMTQMPDKDRPSLLPDPPPHLFHSVFNFQSSTRMEEVGGVGGWGHGCCC